MPKSQEGDWAKETLRDVVVVAAAQCLPAAAAEWPVRVVLAADLAGSDGPLYICGTAAAVQPLLASLLRQRRRLLGVLLDAPLALGTEPNAEPVPIEILVPSLRGGFSARAWEDVVAAVCSRHVDTIQEMIYAHALSTPDKAMLVFQENELSFREAVSMAWSLSDELAARGFAPEAGPIAVQLLASDLLAVVYLGLMMGSYVAHIVDAHPTSRAYKLSACPSQVLLCSAAAAAEELPTELPVLRVEDLRLDRGLALENVACKGGLEDDIFIEYTSGSTGRPKSVATKQWRIAHWIRWRQFHFPPSAGNDRVATNLFYVWYWHIAPCCGGTSVIYPTEMNRDVTALLRYVERHGCSKLESVTPGLISAMVHLDILPPPALRVMASGGEALTTALCREVLRRFAGVEFWNNLALTETAADMSFVRVDEAVAGLDQLYAPVANQILVWNNSFEIADEELVITGWNVADGYLPPTASDRFQLSEDGRSNRYRTGDRAVWVDGCLFMRGRLDSTVKVRGFRVDLAGLEAVMDECPAVRDVAFVPFRESIWATVVSSDLDAVQRFAEERLEHYSLIVWHSMAVLPYTNSHKRDRKRIQQLLTDALAEELPGGRPQTEVEARVAEAWREILGREVGREESWTQAGGHSISAMKLASVLGLSPADVYAFPTVAAMASRLAPAPSTLAQARAIENPQYSDSDDRRVAIIGVSCRFPGAPSRLAFWEALRAGKDLLSDIPGASPDQVPRKGRVPDEGFDCRFWGVRREAAALMDTAQRVLLEVAYEALEDAGFDPFNVPGRVGVVVCGGSLPHYATEKLGIDLEESRVERPDEYFALEIGGDKDYLATSVSYRLNLHGPSEVVQTACSSSLVAVVRAVQLLRLNACDYVVCGGASFSPEAAVRKVDGMIWSPDGVCRPFAADANGTVNADGCGLVVLTRADAALRRKEWIYAHVLGAASNNDGARKAGYSAPSYEGQAEVIRMAMADAGVTGDDIDYVEAHGTGTRLGDPLEVRALADALQTRREVLLGSVKGNIGHMNTAAGIPGLIKVTEMLWRQQMVPSLHCEHPSSFIDWEQVPLRMSSSAAPWKGRVAGLSSFGIGGTNAHVVVGYSPVQDDASPRRRSSHLFVGSARDVKALRSWSVRVDEAAAGVDPVRVEATLLKRVRFEHRCFGLRVGDMASSPIVSSRRPVVLLFPGQGAAFQDMGKQLADEGLIHRNWEGVEPVDVVKASLMVAAALKRQGLVVQAVFGHSVGEWAAAAFAGIVPPGDAIRLAQLRGELMKRMERGFMLSVRGDEAHVKDIVSNGVEVACLNGTKSLVLAGPEGALEATQATLDGHGLTWKRISVDHAFHTSAVDRILPSYASALEKVHFSNATIPVLSNVTGGWHGDEAKTAKYWIDHLRQPVRFHDNLRHIAQKFPECVIVEVGPTALAGVVARESKQLGVDWQVAPTMRPGDEVDTYLRCLGMLWTRTDFEPALPVGSTALVPLPTYSFSRDPLGSNPSGAEAASGVPETSSTRRQTQPAETPAGASKDVFYETFYERIQVSSLHIRGATAVLDGPAPQGLLPEGTVFAAMDRAVPSASCTGCLFFLGMQEAWPGKDDTSQEVLVEMVVKLIDELTKAKSSVDTFFVLKQGCIRYAGLLGLLRSAAREHPELRLRILLWENGARLLLPVMPAELLLRADGPYAPRLRPVPVPSPSPASAALAGSARSASDCRVLVTGGLRGLGTCVAAWLVATGRATSLVLVGRNPAEGEAAEIVRGLRQNSVAVEERLCDVSRWAEVQQLPDCDLVLHVAGNVKDGLLVHASSADVQRVLGPKVRGSLNLKARYPNARLLGFSSTSGRFGSAAQATYAFANAFMDSVMPSIQWNAWAEVGMVKDLDISPLPGERFMPVTEGLEYLGKVLDAPERSEPLCVIDCSWKVFRQNPTQFWPEDPLLAAVESKPLISLLGSATKIGDQARTWDMVVGAAGARHLGTHAAWEVCQQHVMGQTPIFPATAFIAIALEATREILGSTTHVQLSNITFLRPLDLASARRLTTTFVQNVEGRGGTFRFTSQPIGQGPEILHCTCGAGPAPSEPVAFHGDADLDAMAPVEGLYRSFEAAGFHYGPAFRTSDAQSNGNYACCRLPSSRGSGFHLSPATLDAALHLASLLHPLGCRGVPQRVRSFTASASTGATDKAFARRRGLGVDAALSDADGHVLCVVEGLELAALDAAPSLQLRKRVWLPAPPEPRRGMWLARGDASRLGLSRTTADPGVAHEAEVLTVHATSVEDVLRCREEVKRVLATSPCWVLALEAPFAKAAAAAAAEAGAQVLIGSAEDVASAADHVGIGAKFVRASQGQLFTEALEPAVAKEPLTVSCHDAFSVVVDPCLGAKGATCCVSNRKPPGPGEVELRTSIWALNFRDVLVAVGAIPTEVAGQSLGIGGECFGEVARVGPGTCDLNVGDRVIAVPPDGMGSYVTVDSRWVSRAPDMSPEEAVAGTCAYATAWLGLRWLARVDRSDRVLIHSAAGGVGLAAVHLCLREDCTVYVTASTREKRDFLLSLGVSGAFDSRNPAAFEQGVLLATNGEGVDVVLNSLSGEAIPTSLRILRPFGRFIEIGKRDQYEGTAMDLSPFLNGLTYAAAHLDVLMLRNPDRCRRLLEEVWKDMPHLPKLPTKSFDIGVLPDALEYFSKGVHIGKVLVKVHDTRAFPARPTFVSGPPLDGVTQALRVGLGAGDGPSGVACIPSLDDFSSSENLADAQVVLTTSRAVAEMAELVCPEALCVQLPRWEPVKGISDWLLVGQGSFMAVEEERAGNLKDWLMDVVNEMASSMSVDQTFESAGFDSLALISLARRISTKLGRAVSVVDLYEHPSPQQLLKSLGSGPQMSLKQPKILCLHGFRSNKEAMQLSLAPYVSAVGGFEWVFVNSPRLASGPSAPGIPKEEAFEWWGDVGGSYETGWLAPHYDGLEETLTAISSLAPVGVVGFSQGGGMACLLDCSWLALFSPVLPSRCKQRETQCYFSWDPKEEYISQCIRVANHFPNHELHEHNQGHTLPHDATLVAGFASFVAARDGP